MVRKVVTPCEDLGAQVAAPRAKLEAPFEQARRFSFRHSAHPLFAPAA